MGLRAHTRLVGSLALAAVALVVAALSSRPEPVALAAPFLVTVFVGLLSGGRPAVAVDVGLDRSRAVAGEVVEVVATITGSPSAHWVEAWVEVPDGFELVEPLAPGGPGDDRLSDASVEVLLRGGQVVLRWRLRAERWGGVPGIAVRVRASDRVGLRSTSSEGRSIGLRILPEAGTLRRIVAPRSLRSIPGGHPSRHRGDGVEFADMRPFVAGDRARAVNWRATARRGELWVDERHPDRSGEVVLFVDSFASIGRGRDDTLRLTVEAARAIAGRHIAANDRVGLVDLGGVLRWVRPAGGTVQLQRIAEALADAEVWASTVDKPLEVLPPRALPRRGLVIGLSPLLDPRSIATVARMRARGLDVALIEVSPERAVDAPGSARGVVAERLWRTERAATRSQLRRLGIGVAEWSDGPLEPVLDQLLAYRQAVSRWAR